MGTLTQGPNGQSPTPEMENVKAVHALPPAFLGEPKTAKYQRANEAGPLS